MDRQKELIKDFEEENQDSVLAFYKYLIEREGDLEKFSCWIDGKTYEDVVKEYQKFRGIEDLKEIKDINRRTLLIRFNRLIPKNIVKDRVTIGCTNDYKYKIL